MLRKLFARFKHRTPNTNNPYTESNESEFAPAPAPQVHALSSDLYRTSSSSTLLSALTAGDHDQPPAPQVAKLSAIATKAEQPQIQPKKEAWFSPASSAEEVLKANQPGQQYGYSYQTHASLYRSEGYINRPLVDKPSRRHSLRLASISEDEVLDEFTPASPQATSGSFKY